LDKEQGEPLEVLVMLADAMGLVVGQVEIESLIGHLDAYQAKGLSFLLVQKPDAIMYAPVFKEVLRRGLRKDQTPNLEDTINRSIERLQAEINQRHETR
jgi:hypothetical protein